LLSLTPKGMKAVGVIKDLGEEIEEIISKFDDKDKEVLEDLLIKLSKNLSQKGYVANAEICKTCRYFNSNRYPRASKPHYCEYFNIVLGEKDIYKECPDYKDVLN